MIFAANLFFLSLATTKPTVAMPGAHYKIPNGHSVPNPGPQGGIWAGVGHLNAAGGGPRNQFGLDFKDEGFEWTVALCEMDSDGDGRTNGEELGDPDCEWVMGDEPKGPAISHPGLVDTPANSTSKSYCDDYEDPDDVEVLDIAFTAANTLDSTRTHYRCEQLTVDPPQGINEQFLVRSDVIVSNSDVLHHIWIYHCSDGNAVTSSDGDFVDQGAYECNGVENNCQIIAGWAVGPEANCEPPNVAAYVDFTSSNVFKIEVHYDNAAMVNNVKDQSGMSLRMTPTPRNLVAGMSILGMDYRDRQFTIPANQESYSLSNICPTEATLRGLNQPIYVYAWNPHMHLYGTKLVTEHYRCGEKIGEIGRIEQYEFDNQQTYALNPPIKVLPGDALVTTCTYNTSNVDTDIIGGEQTTEEMCDNYLSYYPWAGNSWEPTLFTACIAFEAGENPDYTWYDDSTRFAIVDLAGNAYIESWSTNPAENAAPCCSTNSCESNFLAGWYYPCGINSDCEEGLVCEGGICKSEWEVRSSVDNSVKSGSAVKAAESKVEVERNVKNAKSVDNDESTGKLQNEGGVSEEGSINVGSGSTGSAFGLMIIITTVAATTTLAFF